MTINGWRRNAFASAFGVCATLAQPPFFIFPLLVPAFCGLLLLVAAAPTPKRAFFDGWWWGFGYFTTGLYWMCIALLVDPWKFAWLIPFTLVGLNGIIALYPALAAWAYHRLRLRAAPLHVLVFASIWTLVEYARGHLFTGFPWNLTGYAWSGYDSVAQAASVIGVYGLSFVTVLAAAIPVVLFDLRSSAAGTAPLNGASRFAPGSIAALALVWGAFALMAAGGAWRLREAPISDAAGVNIRIVQAAVPQSDKWDPEKQEKALEDYMQLSNAPGFDRLTYVIWPEVAMPYLLNKEASLLNILRMAVPPQGQLITGTLRSDPQGRFYNSMAFIGHEGPPAYYDKHHLVPFGEFVPFRRWLPVERIAPGPHDFSRGPGPRTLAAGHGISASPLICYEAIFPGEAVAKGARPDVLLNITNDAWFGNSTGPYQHFYMAKMRAVEQGIPLLRAANTGISGVVDAYGRVRATLPLGARGVLDAELPRPLQKATTYSSVGDVYLLLLACFVVLFTALRQYKGIFNR